MRKHSQKITVAVSALLIGATLIGINANEAIAQSKARKRAKVRSGGGAGIAPATEIPFIPPLIDMDTRNPMGTSDYRRTKSVRSPAVKRHKKQ